MALSISKYIIVVQRGEMGAPRGLLNGNVINQYLNYCVAVPASSH